MRSGTPAELVDETTTDITHQLSSLPTVSPPALFCDKYFGPVFHLADVMGDAESHASAGFTVVYKRTSSLGAEVLINLIRLDRTLLYYGRRRPLAPSTCQLQTPRKATQGQRGTVYESAFPARLNGRRYWYTRPWHSYQT